MAKKLSKNAKDAKIIDSCFEESTKTVKEIGRFISRVSAVNSQVNKKQPKRILKIKDSPNKLLESLDEASNYMTSLYKKEELPSVIAIPLKSTTSVYDMIDFFAVQKMDNAQYRKWRNNAKDRPRDIWTVVHNGIVMEALQMYASFFGYKRLVAKAHTHSRKGKGVPDMREEIELEKQEMLKKFSNTVVEAVQNEQMIGMNDYLNRKLNEKHEMSVASMYAKMQTGVNAQKDRELDTRIADELDTDSYEELKRQGLLE